MGVTQAGLFGEIAAANMDPGGEQPVQPRHQIALVDEADSILIDDAHAPDYRLY